MELLTIIFIAIGLAMDAFAVSIAAGGACRDMKTSHGVRMAIFFGGFQALMPLIGWLAGLGLKDTIAAYDHWVAFGLLAAVGGKMIYESFKLNPEPPANPANITTLLILSVATSIDALAVGVTLAVITDDIFATVAIIGGITFLLSYAGYRIGRGMGHFFEKKIEILGGIILIAIGVKILISHLYA